MKRKKSSSSLLMCYCTYLAVTLLSINLHNPFLPVKTSNLPLTTILKTKEIRSHSLVSYATPRVNFYLYTSCAVSAEEAKLGQIGGIESWSANQQQLLISNNNLQLQNWEQATK
uniref:Uncharacterized protein n=1 Tax=Glossina pallidipes TaxID=7398 RepID=A0A1A9Z7Y8_GLOPL